MKKFLLTLVCVANCAALPSFGYFDSALAAVAVWMAITSLGLIALKAVLLVRMLRKLFTSPVTTVGQIHAPRDMSYLFDDNDAYYAAKKSFDWYERNYILGLRD